MNKRIARDDSSEWLDLLGKERKANVTNKIIILLLNKWFWRAE
jgi:hypothetical protein